MSSRWPRRTFAFAAAIFVLDVGGAYALDALGLVESLLSPNGLRAIAILPLALVFFLARLLLFFVVPGLCVASLLIRWIRRQGAEPTAPRAPRRT